MPTIDQQDLAALKKMIDDNAGTFHALIRYLAEIGMNASYVLGHQHYLNIRNNPEELYLFLEHIRKKKGVFERAMNYLTTLERGIDEKLEHIYPNQLQDKIKNLIKISSYLSSLDITEYKNLKNEISSDSDAMQKASKFLDYFIDFRSSGHSLTNQINRMVGLVTDNKVIPVKLIESYIKKFDQLDKFVIDKGNNVPGKSPAFDFIKKNQEMFDDMKSFFKDISGDDQEEVGFMNAVDNEHTPGPKQLYSFAKFFSQIATSEDYRDVHSLPTFNISNGLHHFRILLLKLKDINAAYSTLDAVFSYDEDNNVDLSSKIQEAKSIFSQIELEDIILQIGGMDKYDSLSDELFNAVEEVNASTRPAKRMYIKNYMTGLVL
ncbi:hypothetical protein Cyrtocomes_00792 [Candidatus Cyrtobacter comes]|uniref:Uncharacterized protein n=1 Tax=Candidatus Cyrtobacter comes TaxID=675776 RepID=A0ABU5L8Q2_9RICK|nr:hypothetical protein [Candidatus Cyrtobacter comes]MDZ5762412.1 hypothetical protein [Candidatus Cyrtobacter comes]